MTARLEDCIGAGERRRVPLGASCSHDVASEWTRRLKVDEGRWSKPDQLRVDET